MFAVYNLWILDPLIDDLILEILGSYNNLCTTPKALHNFILWFPIA